METVKLGLLIKKTKVARCGEHSYPVLSITKQDGIIMQSEKFKKRIASADTSDYKIIPRGKLVQGIHIDEGNFGIQDIVDNGIVSPAYGVWDINDGLVIPKYLEMVLRSPKSIEFYRSKLTGTVNRRGHMSDADFLSMDIPLPDRDTQSKILKTMKQTTSVLYSRQQQLAKLDELIKARFVEMFGDPVNNPLHWKKVKLSELADIKIGPFGSLLHKEDYVTGGHPLVNPSHIIDGKIIVDNDLTLTDEKYSELVSYHLKKDDIVLGRRGEMGRCAVVDREGLLCGTGSLLLRPTGVVTADYIQKIISFPTFKKTIEDMAVGQTMPNLNVPIVSNFMIILPPLSVQKEYYAFAAEVDKSKLFVGSAVAHKPFDIEFFSKSTVQRFIKEV
jgi:type I restriction enzyme S subunit